VDSYWNPYRGKRYHTGDTAPRKTAEGQRCGCRHTGATVLPGRGDTRRYLPDSNSTLGTPYNANPDLALHYDNNDDWPPSTPVAMCFNSTVLDEFLRDWAKVQQQLWRREITEAEYFERKICWPTSN